MITKRAKVYASYLYTRIKYKGITVYIKNQKWSAYIIVSKGTLHFKYFSEQ